MTPDAAAVFGAPIERFCLVRVHRVNLRGAIKSLIQQFDLVLPRAGYGFLEKDIVRAMNGCEPDRITAALDVLRRGGILTPT